MRKYNKKSNVSGNVIEKFISESGITQEDLCKKLQLLGISFDRVHLYRVMRGQVILKDFELIAIAKILDMDLNILKTLIEE